VARLQRELILIDPDFGALDMSQKVAHREYHLISKSGWSFSTSVRLF
jgi:hypothetical protein